MLTIRDSLSSNAITAESAIKQVHPYKNDANSRLGWLGAHCPLQSQMQTFSGCSVADVVISGTDDVNPSCAHLSVPNFSNRVLICVYYFSSQTRAHRGESNWLK